MKKLPENINHRWYMRRFWHHVSENNHSRHPMRDAHISVESELRDDYGVVRYTTYKSFSAAKSRKRSGLRVKSV